MQIKKLYPIRTHRMNGVIDGRLGILPLINKINIKEFKIFN